MKKILFLISLFVVSCEDVQTDSTPPIIGFQNVQENSSLLGVYSISVYAFDNKGIKEVQFFIDEVLKASLSKQPSSDYIFSYDKNEFNNDNHQIFAKAIDASGNEAKSGILHTFDFLDNDGLVCFGKLEPSSAVDFIERK